jgi:hypothetical protein
MSTLRLNVFLLAGMLCVSKVSAEEIVVRLIDVNSGRGEKNCYVYLYLGDPNDRPPPGHTKILRTDDDGRVRFQIPEPLPSVVWMVGPQPQCVIMCSRPGPWWHLVSVDEVLRTGVAGPTNDRGPDGKPYCSPNLKKLEAIQAKPGEILLFVRKPSLLERWILAQ